MNKRKWLTAMLMAGLFTACYYDKKELVYQSDPVAPACDTLAVTYQKNIAPILSASCTRCHGGAATGGAGIKLDSYTNAKNMALFGSLLQVVRHDAGFTPMPRGGAKLSDCNIAQIRIWIANGAPEN